MTIIVFLIDTSASMNQRAYLGGRPTLLDVAKGAVETFVKIRQRSQDSRGDRYMLLTFEEPPANIKAGWKENLLTFMNELKNLQCNGMTTMGPALKHAFDVLNINRMQTGIDTYGQGRSPFFLEPSVIIVITDGGRLSNNIGIQEDLNVPMHSTIPGSELTREPFRWDQRLFSLVLRLSGTPAVERDIGLVPSDCSPVDAMCEVTGGRSYCITSHRMLMQCIDSLTQKVHSGVVINFEKIGPDPPPVANEGGVKEQTDGLLMDTDTEIKVEKEWERDYSASTDEETILKNGVRTNGIPKSILNNSTSWHSCRRLIYVPRSATKGFAVGHWPIPESFWPDLSASSLPPRYAHPNVKFTCTSQEPMVIENLPFDKYELEPSPLTQYILARKQPTVCWQVFVANSYKNSEVGHPFGYLKASTNLTCVNLFVMPYNYPVLLPLLDEFFKVHRLKPTSEWRTQFQNYLRTMPSYYAGPLRRALVRMNVATNLAQVLVPETLDTALSYSVLNYLKRLKNQAKTEFERICNEVSAKAASNLNQIKSGVVLSGIASEGIRVTPRTLLKKDLVSHPLLQDKFTSLREQMNDFAGFVVGLPRGMYPKGQQSYRNPYDVSRRCLLDQVVRMRANFLQPTLTHTKLLDDDFVHSMPVSQMGNYQEYLKRQQPQLREIESTPVRQHMFGNPFKIDKRMMVDEADIDLVGSSGSGPGSARGLKRQTDPLSPRPPNKRKPGPIPRHFTVRRPSAVSPCTSPVPWSPPPSPGPASPAEMSLPASTATADFSRLPIVNGDIKFENPFLSPRFSPPSSPVTVNHVTEKEDKKLVLSEHMNNHVSSGMPQVISQTATVPHVNNSATNSELSKHEAAEIRKHNLSVRALAYKEVRRLGKKHDGLFDHLRTLKGGLDVRISVLKEVTRECLRFKRRTLADLVEEHVREILAASGKKLINNHHHPSSNNGASKLS